MKKTEIIKNMNSIAETMKRGILDAEAYHFNEGMLAAYSEVIGTAEAKELYKETLKEGKKARERMIQRNNRRKEIRERMEELDALRWEDDQAMNEYIALSEEYCKL